MTCSIVIPCYNSEESIGLLVEKIFALGIECEVILVDDNSKDGTWAAIEAAVETHASIKAFSLARNVGQHNALLIGIRAATFDTIVTMDDDLQHDPGDILKMLERLETGADLVYCVPRETRQTIGRRITSHTSKWVFEKILKMPNAANSSAFRAFSKTGVEAVNAFSGHLVDIDAILSWGVRRVDYLTVEHHQRQFGRSNYTYTKLMAHAFKMVIAYSELPLLFSFFLGVAVLVISLILALYHVSIALLEGTTVPGFTMLLCTILFFSGVQIVMIGILSRYVGSVHAQVNGRPIAVVKTVLGRERASYDAMKQAAPTKMKSSSK
ncbi:MAG: glycosyltransferase family 2 protein [Pseudomonadota bacterium]